MGACAREARNGNDGNASAVAYSGYACTLANISSGGGAFSSIKAQKSETLIWQGVVHVCNALFFVAGADGRHGLFLLAPTT